MSYILELMQEAPMMQNVTSRICLVLVAVILLCLATLMPKNNKKLLAVESVLVAAGMAAVLLVAKMIANRAKFLEPAAALRSMFSGNITIYIVYAMIFIVVWGIFFDRAPLTQAMYGMCISVALPIGLFRMLFPSWTWNELDCRVQIENFAEIFTNDYMLVKFLVFCALFFVPVWLIATGKYRLSLNTIWHLAYGVVGFGSVITFMAQAGKLDIKYNATVKQLISVVTENGFNKDTALDLIKLLGFGVLVIIVISLGAAIIRRITTGEKLMNSKTTSATVTRIAGRILSIVVSALLVVFLPAIKGANNMETLVGMPGALIFLLPLAAILVITTIGEYFAQRAEIMAESASEENA